MKIIKNFDNTYEQEIVGYSVYCRHPEWSIAIKDGYVVCDYSDDDPEDEERGYIDDAKMVLDLIDKREIYHKYEIHLFYITAYDSIRIKFEGSCKDDLVQTEFKINRVPRTR